MSVRVMSWVWDESASVGNARLVLLAIADCANHDGTDAWPTAKEIARKTQLHRSTVLRCIAGLEDLGELEVRHSPGRHRNVYRIVMDDPPPVDNSGERSRDATVDRPERSQNATDEPRPAETQRSHGCDRKRSQDATFIENRPGSVLSPLPPPASPAGEPCPAHKHLGRPHPSCRACGTSPRVAVYRAQSASRADNRTPAEATASGCDHGYPSPAVCPFCRRGRSP